MAYLTKYPNTMVTNKSIEIRYHHQYPITQLWRKESVTDLSRQEKNEKEM